MKNTTSKNASSTAIGKKAPFAKTAGIIMAAALVFALAAAVPAFAQGGRAGSASAASPCMRACATAACKGFSDIGACGKNAWCEVSGCAGFVDADGNGVCDNFGSGIGRGKGAGVGWLAQERAAQAGVGRQAGQGFVDADGDGVCDAYVDADGNGVCDGCVQACGEAGCVDADGDGVCDACGLNVPGCFVDADGNGVCDRYADGNGDGVCDNRAGCRGAGAGCGSGGCGQGRFGR